MLISMSSQIVWLNFAGIVSPQMEEIFHVGLGPISLMSGLWPLLFIPISIPTGLMVDKWGFKRIVSIGGVIIVVFSWLRLLSGQSFAILFIFQSLAGIGQPFVYNGISKLAGNWFPKGEQALANGIATMGQIIGMILALVIVPIMVPNPIFSELQENIVVVSLIVTLSVLLFLVFAREYPKGTIVAASSQERITSQIQRLLKMRNIVLLMFLFLIGVGIFSGLVQWVEAILFSKGISSLDGGLIGAAMLVSGIFGMIIISYVSDRYSKLKQIVILNSLLTAILLFLFALRMNLLYYTIIAVAIGFTLLSLAPVGLQISLETAGKERAGTAAGMIWLMSQVGALFFILVMPVLDTLQLGLKILVSDQWFISLIFSGILMIVAFVIGLMLKDTRKNRVSFN
jgi:FLVCR family MFS transporter 7